MSVINLNECDCDCHFHEGIVHIMACCEQCPICFMRVRYNIEKHIENHDKVEPENEGFNYW